MLTSLGLDKTVVLTVATAIIATWQHAPAQLKENAWAVWIKQVVAYVLLGAAAVG